jgi:hypothetical protein
MAGSDTADADGSMGIGLSTIQFALRAPPPRFTAATFAQRICQHLIVYSGFLVAAIYACLLVFMPAETAALSLGGIALAGVVVLLSPSSRRKLHRLVMGGVAASYIAGAAALLKAFEAFLHRI